ncbi:alpha/beta hydrolase [Kutzneria sp. CA-103260]|uniref:alpha/beta hydrolase n=1 Tax=Kutzneria sp. CA-103260 TaxID=2802641 RepID=UPI001BAC0313|nr:alpha/beta hydrolase [Kutzneria sp. CA-103260]QUQ66054.1 alpha/beta hydrolase [Kutzneria sp. CA-103260]
MRATVHIGGIEAWVHPASAAGRKPAVVMGHGLGAVKAGGLQPFAERFQAEGVTAITFDYRQWGSSAGWPRDELSVPRQLDDYRAVIAWARAQPDLDPDRIVVWGTSFAGMHVVELAATDPALAGAIAQAPLVDGAAGTRNVPLPRLVRLVSLGLLDKLGSMLGRRPIYLPVNGDAGELAMVATDDAMTGARLIDPGDARLWRNRVTARSVLAIGAHRPVRKAAEIRIPILMVVAETDAMAPVGPALRVAELAARGELVRYSGAHYDVYRGGAAFDEVVEAEVEFLRRIVQ